MNAKNLFTALIGLAFASFAHGQAVYKSVNDYPVPQSASNEMNYSPAETTFSLWAPAAKAVWVNIENDSEGHQSSKSLKMKPQSDGCWTRTVKGNLLGKLYDFSIRNGQTIDRSVGIFAKAVTANGAKAAVVDMKATNPAGWENDVRPVLRNAADLMVYELHYRDISMHPSSGIKNKGKFIALTEVGTHNAEGQSTGLDHIRQLGVNAVQIMPSFDYGSVDETQLEKNKYNWGYDPVNYNAPEGSYSTNPNNPAVRIKEMKSMIQSLHKSGLRVIMDVVYNHTFAIKGSNFNSTAPGYFYRYNAKGEPCNASGCGNETASEREMMRKYMVESVCYWVKEYHIDGFRFDLMGIHDLETMKAIRAALDAIDPSITLYGEGWAAGAPALPDSQLAMKKNIGQLDRIGAFGDEMRDALRGPFSDDHQGAFLASLPYNEESVKFGIVGCIDHPDIDMTKVNYSKAPWTAQPQQAVSYVSCHDDMCLADRLRSELPQATEDEILRLDKLAQTAVFTSQGIPFILCGEELFRSKQGVHNSFDSPDAINEINWENKSKYNDLYQYYCGLTQMRRNHPVLRLGDAEAVRRDLHFVKTELPCMVAFTVKDAKEEMLVVLNGAREEGCIDVPEGDWHILIRNGTVDNAAIQVLKGGAVKIAPQSALILVR